MESIITQVGSRDFARLRIGIGRPGDRSPDEVADYVEKQFLSGSKQNVLIKAGKGIKQREVWRICKAATRNESVQQLYVAVTEVK